MWSPCNQAHFMTIKAGNVVVKVRRSLCSLFSCHISSGFHNLVKYFSHFFRKEKYSMDDFFSNKLCSERKASLLRKPNYNLLVERIIVGNFADFLILPSRIQIHSKTKKMNVKQRRSDVTRCCLKLTHILTLYALCIILQYVYKPTRCTKFL